MKQNTPEWLEFRRSKIGASDAPIIMGVSPWKTPKQLWNEKVYGVTKEVTPNMLYGKEMEEKAREELVKQTGIMFVPRVVQHKKYDWMIASLDGIDIDGKVIAEIKCASAADHKLAKSGKIPPKYYPQLQHQLEVTGADKVLYYSYHKGDGMILECEKDEEYLDELLKKENEFHLCMLELRAPELCDDDYVVKADDEWKDLATEWSKCNSELKVLIKKEKILKEALIFLADDKNSIGNGVKLTKYTRLGSVDVTKIAETLNINIDEYRNSPVLYWKVEGFSEDVL